MMVVMVVAVVLVVFLLGMVVVMVAAVLWERQSVECGGGRWDGDGGGDVTDGVSVVFVVLYIWWQW